MKKLFKDLIEKHGYKAFYCPPKDCYTFCKAVGKWVDHVYIRIHLEVLNIEPNTFEFVGVKLQCENENLGNFQLHNFGLTKENILSKLETIESLMVKMYKLCEDQPK